MVPGRVLALSHHAGYGCRHSGACCTSGWRIPVEADRAATIARFFGDVFEQRSRVLRSSTAGACVLFEPAQPGRLPQCAVHRTCGHAALPSACRHFPRIYLHDAYATRLTLSHFCPTAASLLFIPGDVRIVEPPAGLAPPDDREGLDARDALPPLLRPGMLMDVDSYGAWEAEAVRVLAEGPGSVEASVAHLESICEDIRGWRPGAAAALVEHVSTAFRRPVSDRTAAGRGAVAADAVSHEHGRDPWRPWYELALASVPTGLAHSAPPDDAGRRDERYVASAWAEFEGPLRRYAASRLFGSWVAYQGRGLRTIVASVRCALAVVRLEAVRACAAAGRPLDAGLLQDAVRAAELLLVHKADRQELASRLSATEDRDGRAVC